MTARCPAFGGITDNSTIGDVVSRVKELEECLASFMKQQSNQIKELSEIVAVNQNKPAVPIINLVKDKSVVETPGSKRKRLNDNQIEAVQPSAPPLEPHGQVQASNEQPPRATYADKVNQNRRVTGITPLNQSQQKFSVNLWESNYW